MDIADLVDTPLHIDAFCPLVQLRWVEQKVIEYREWIRDPFRWDYAETAEESLDGFMSWLEDNRGERY